MLGPILKGFSAPPLSILLTATLLLQVTVNVVSDQNDTLTSGEVKNLIQSTFPTIPPPNNCSCVVYYLCKNPKINTNGEDLIDIRQNNYECPSYMDVCCYDLIPTVPATNELDEVWEGCGKWNTRGVILRSSHNESEFSEFPSMTAIIRLQPDKSKTLLCGGSLIHPKVVLTAAHWVRGIDQNDLVIRTGEWDSQTEKEILRHQDRKVLKIIIHEKYYAGALFNDVALIIVAEPFSLTRNVGTMCLPSQNYVFNKEKCFATGWGKDKFGESGVHQAILKKLNLPIVPRTRCLGLLQKTSLGMKFELHDGLICAGGKVGIDTCEGDGGGPLMCFGENSKQLHQVGITSWGIGCGNETPGIYVNVAYYKKWIDGQMAKEHLSTKYYDPDYVPSK